MARVLTQDAHHTTAAHYLALVTNLLDAGTNLHRNLVLARSLNACRRFRGYVHYQCPAGSRSLILPRPGSRGETSTRIRSPGMTRTRVCFATPLRDTFKVAPSFVFTRYKPCGSTSSTVPSITCAPDPRNAAGGFVEMPITQVVPGEGGTIEALMRVSTSSSGPRPSTVLTTPFFV